MSDIFTDTRGGGRGRFLKPKPPKEARHKLSSDGHKTEKKKKELGGGGESTEHDMEGFGPRELYPRQKKQRDPVEHELKIWPKPFEAILKKKARAQLRKDDRSPKYESGDRMMLREYLPDKDEYTGARIKVDVVHVARTEECPAVPEGYALITIEPTWYTAPFGEGLIFNG
jgi:hypothetical protein